MITKNDYKAILLFIQNGLPDTEDIDMDTMSLDQHDFIVESDRRLKQIIQNSLDYLSNY